VPGARHQAPNRAKTYGEYKKVEKLRVSVAGVGNNISALMQGISYYETRHTIGIPPGIRNHRIGDLEVSDIDLVGGFDVSESKIGKPLVSAIFAEPNNYIDIGVELPRSDAAVTKGLVYRDGQVSGHERVIKDLKETNAELLLYSLPAGMQWAADGYKDCALDAGVGLVNCTPEVIARNPETLVAFQQKGIALIGDDLASHLGTSTLHRELLSVLINRGLRLESSYQLNLGGNADFANLRENGGSKAQSKKNALSQEGLDLERVEVIPSAGFIGSLEDRKVAYVNIVARGWANTEIRIDLKLEVQDSSNAAGVIIDLLRIAGLSQRLGKGGFNVAAASFLKSPPGGHTANEKQLERAAFEELNRFTVA
jgi:myo-inositol-1-phosphate synthase